MNAVSALNKTAAADKSFTFFICSFFSGETKSAIFSMDELRISVTNTKPHAKINTIHSMFEILRANPSSITTNVENT